MSIQRFVLDQNENKYFVTNMFDEHAVQTDDPKFASTAVVQLGPDAWQALKTDEVTIWTIH
jgi:hypothetical protein